MNCGGLCANSHGNMLLKCHGLVKSHSKRLRMLWLLCLGCCLLLLLFEMNSPATKTIRINKRKYQVVSVCLDWDYIFEINHLFFSFLEFIGLPACLYLAAVHSSWKQRIWPRQVLSQKQHATALINKRIKRSTLNFSQHSLFSPNASFGYVCQKVVFSKLPETTEIGFHIMRQFFNLYTKLNSIEINFQLQENYDEKTNYGEQTNYYACVMLEMVLFYYIRNLRDSGEKYLDLRLVNSECFRTCISTPFYPSQLNYLKTLKNINFRNLCIEANSFVVRHLHLENLANLNIQCLNIFIKQVKGYEMSIFNFGKSPMCKKVNISIDKIYVDSDGEWLAPIGPLTTCVEFSLQIGEVVVNNGRYRTPRYLPVLLNDFDNLKSVTLSKNMFILSKQAAILKARGVNITYI